MNNINTLQVNSQESPDSFHSECKFCPKIIDNSVPVMRITNLTYDIFYNVLEKFILEEKLDMTELIGSEICEKCNQSVQKFNKFKLDAMDNQKVILRNVDPLCYTIDLKDVLVAIGKLKKSNDLPESLKVCRLCLKTNLSGDHFTMLSMKNMASSKAIIACLPGFNIHLTEKAFLCTNCDSSILDFYKFMNNVVMFCNEKKHDVEVELNVEPPVKSQVKSKTLDVANRRKRGRPRKNPIKDKSIAKKKVEHKNILDRRKILTGKRERPRYLLVPKKHKPIESNNQMTKSDSEHKISSSNMENSIFNSFLKFKQKIKNANSVTGSLKIQKVTSLFDGLTSEELMNLKKLKVYNKEIQSSLVYVCNVCYGLITADSEITEHIKMHNGQVSFVQMCVCPFSNCFYLLENIYLFENHYVNHLKVQAQKKFLRCQKCPYRTSSYLELLIHYSYHLKKGEYECDHCTFSNNSEKEVTAHEFLHSNQSQDSASLMDEDISDLIFKCLLCFKSFESAYGIDIHILKQHLALKDKFVNCPRCNKQFKLKDTAELDDHYWSHEMFLFLCAKRVPNQKGTNSKAIEESTKNLRAVRILRKEEASTSQEQEFRCGHCLMLFYTLDDLDSHQCVPDKILVVDEGNTATTSISRENRVGNSQSIDDEMQIDSVNKPEDYEDYECSYCLQNFVTLKELDSHTCKGDVEDPGNFPLSKSVIVGDEINSMVADSPEESPIIVATLPSQNLENYNAEQMEVINKTKDISMDKEVIYRKATTEVNINNTKPKTMPKKLNPDFYRKKNLISRIAENFGVKIEEKTEKTKLPELKCICNFTTTFKKDFLFHMEFCEKLWKCIYCTYKTTISDKLEFHCWDVHNINVFVCSLCPFISAMEENYNLHSSKHEKTNEKSDPEDEEIWYCDNLEFLSDNLNPDTDVNRLDNILKHESEDIEIKSELLEERPSNIDLLFNDSVPDNNIDMIDRSSESTLSAENFDFLSSSDEFNEDTSSLNNENPTTEVSDMTSKKAFELYFDKVEKEHDKGFFKITPALKRLMIVNSWRKLPYNEKIPFFRKAKLTENNLD